MSYQYDAVVVGSGPNGLSAAIELARAGWAVKVFEANESIGGGVRSEELTQPGFIHDTCSAIHPLAVVSPFFNSLPLEEHGLHWIYPEAALAHPFDDGTAVLLKRSTFETAAALGDDGTDYRQLMEPLVRRANSILDDILRPIRIPRHPFSAARFGWKAIRSAETLILGSFKGNRARSLIAGSAAHSMLPLDHAGTAGIGLLLTMLGHAVGWPLPEGGASRITAALVSYLESLGGEIEIGTRVDDIDALPPARAVLLDLTPKQVIRIAGLRLEPSYRHQLSAYRYGSGVFKIDWALSDAVPWKAPECRQAGTVHLGSDANDIARAEQQVWDGGVPERPFVILAQQSLFDPGRAPVGKHVAWAYCHVPTGSPTDMTGAIEAQVERFAPGFKDCIIGRSTRTAPDMERKNTNYLGGDINGGIQDIRQTLFRPVVRWDPYRTSAEELFLCSSSTPPGGGVHGMCGYNAARSVLRNFSLDPPRVEKKPR